MVGPACEEFTAEGWWPLVEWLTEQLHRRVAQLRRDRTAFVGKGPLLFYGRAPELECVGWLHDNPQFRPRAWVSVDLRLGKPVRISDSGRSVWEREVTLEARLPEAHQRRIAQETLWRCSDGRRRRVLLAPGALHALVREHGRSRLPADASQPPLIPPLIPPRVWINPGRTPREVTRMALLLIFWCEGMVTFGPAESPDAWAWVMGWTGAIEDAQLWERLMAMRRRYVDPEKRHRLRMALATVGRQRARRGDALNYARPLRDGFPADPGTSDVDDGESAELETSQ